MWICSARVALNMNVHMYIMSQLEYLVYSGRNCVDAGRYCFNRVCSYLDHFVISLIETAPSGDFAPLQQRGARKSGRTRLLGLQGGRMGILLKEHLPVFKLFLTREPHLRLRSDQNTIFDF